jgi:hypothetical protein
VTWVLFVLLAVLGSLAVARAQGYTFVRKWRIPAAGNEEFHTSAPGHPAGVAVDASGNVYVADVVNNRIQVFAPHDFVMIEGIGDNSVISTIPTPNLELLNRLVGFNNPPTQPTVTIAPTAPTAKDALKATASASVDPDGDPVTYSYQWYRNGKLQTGRTYPTLAAQWTKAGQTWKCVVTPNDGHVDGPTGEDQVTIGSAASAGPKVTYPNAAGLTFARGQALTIKWQRFTGAKVRIQIYAGGKLARTVSPKTTNDGRFWWRVPNDLPPGDKYRIRIAASDYSCPPDFSDNYFSVK